MSGKRAQRLLQALLIAYICKNTAEKGDGAAFITRNLHSSVRHQAQQASCLQANRFPAGIRAGDNEHAVRGADVDVYGYHGGRVAGATFSLGKMAGVKVCLTTADFWP